MFEYSMCEEDKFDLEVHLGYQIMERHRDIRPGSNEMREVAEAMQKSRRIIIILSRYGCWVFVFGTFK